MKPHPIAEIVSADAPRRFWERPEQYLLDAGRDGELVIARVRAALVAEADARMYEAKRAGRNRVVGPSV